MTIRVGHTAQGKRNRDQRRGPATPFFRAGTVKRDGIDRRPRERVAGTKQLTERHQAVLALVRTVPTKPMDIAAALQLNRGGVTATLYALQDRGLVERVPYKGWKLR